MDGDSLAWVFDEGGAAEEWAARAPANCPVGRGSYAPNDRLKENGGVNGDVLHGGSVSGRKRVCASKHVRGAISRQI